MITYIHTHRYSAHLNDTDTYHSLIYRQSDLDHSSVSGAYCGSADSTINRTMLRLQNSAYEGRSDERVLKKRQATRNSAKIRCWLNLVLDNKYYEELTGNNEDPVSVLFGIILRVSSGRGLMGRRGLLLYVASLEVL